MRSTRVALNVIASVLLVLASVCGVWLLRVVLTWSRWLPSEICGSSTPPADLVVVNPFSAGRLNLIPLYYECTYHTEENRYLGWVTTIGWDYNWLALVTVVLLACGITLLRQARALRDHASGHDLSHQRDEVDQSCPIEEK